MRSSLPSLPFLVWCCNPDVRRIRTAQYDPSLGLPVLRELCLDGNPLGQAGVLAVLRLLMVGRGVEGVVGWVVVMVGGVVQLLE